MADRCVAPPRLHCGLVSAQGRERLRSREGSAGRLLGHGDVKMFRWLIVVGLVFFGTGCQRSPTVPTGAECAHLPGKAPGRVGCFGEKQRPAIATMGDRRPGNHRAGGRPRPDEGAGRTGFSGSDDGGQRVGRNRSGGRAAIPALYKTTTRGTGAGCSGGRRRGPGEDGTGRRRAAGGTAQRPGRFGSQCPLRVPGEDRTGRRSAAGACAGRHQGSSQCGLGLERNRAGGDGRLPRPGQIAQGRGCERSVLGPSSRCFRSVRRGCRFSGNCSRIRTGTCGTRAWRYVYSGTRFPRPRRPFPS